MKDNYNKQNGSLLNQVSNFIIFSHIPTDQTNTVSPTGKKIKIIVQPPKMLSLISANHLWNGNRNAIYNKDNS